MNPLLDLGKLQLQPSLDLMVGITLFTTLNDNLGDRVVEVAVNEVGNFESNSIEIDVLFDETICLIQTKILWKQHRVPTPRAEWLSFVLDENGTFGILEDLRAQSIGVYFLKSQMLMFC